MRTASERARRAGKTAVAPLTGRSVGGRIAVALARSFLRMRYGNATTRAIEAPAAPPPNFPSRPRGERGRPSSDWDRAVRPRSRSRRRDVLARSLVYAYVCFCQALARWRSRTQAAQACTRGRTRQSGSFWPSGMKPGRGGRRKGKEGTKGRKEGRKRRTEPAACLGERKERTARKRRQAVRASRQGRYKKRNQPPHRTADASGQRNWIDS